MHGTAGLFAGLRLYSIVGAGRARLEGIVCRTVVRRRHTQQSLESFQTCTHREHVKEKLLANGIYAKRRLAV